MKYTILSLLAASLLTATATVVSPWNVPAGNKADETLKAAIADQKEMANPIMVAISGMPGKGIRDTSVAAFAIADWNHDGGLTMQEARAMPRVSNNFTLIDTDHDGIVSLAEDQAYIQTYRKVAGK